MHHLDLSIFGVKSGIFQIRKKRFQRFPEHFLEQNLAQTKLISGVKPPISSDEMGDELPDIETVLKSPLGKYITFINSKCGYNGAA